MSGASSRGSSDVPLVDRPSELNRLCHLNCLWGRTAGNDIMHSYSHVTLQLWYVLASYPAVSLKEKAWVQG